MDEICEITPYQKGNYENVRGYLMVKEIGIGIDSAIIELIENRI